MSAPAAMAEDAMDIHPGTPNVYFTQKIAKGEETTPIFDKAATVVEDDFYVGRPAKLTYLKRVAGAKASAAFYAQDKLTRGPP